MCKDCGMERDSEGFSYYKGSGWVSFAEHTHDRIVAHAHELFFRRMKASAYDKAEATAMLGEFFNRTAELLLLEAIHPTGVGERIEFTREVWKDSIEKSVGNYHKSISADYWNNERRMRKANLPFDFGEADKRKMLGIFDGGCALTGSTDFHLDHVIPVASGHGGTIVGNMVPLRGDLNISKHKKNVFVWFNSVREREHLEQERFNAMITYLAEQNGMTVFEYTAYVYECHTKEE